MSRWNPETIAFILLAILTLSLLVTTGGSMLEALGFKHLDWSEVARQKMQSEDPTVRLQGVRLLANLRDGSLITLHRKLLEDPNQAVRRAAIEGLRSRNEAAFLDLHFKALSDPSTSLRQRAVETLQDSGADPWVGEALLKALSDYQPRVQSLALETLVRHYLPASHDKRFSEPLQFLATDPRPSFRLLAVKGLSILKESKAQPILKRLAESDPQPEIRDLAARTLPQLTTVR